MGLVQLVRVAAHANVALGGQLLLLSVICSKLHAGKHDTQQGVAVCARGVARDESSGVPLLLAVSCEAASCVSLLGSTRPKASTH